MKTVTLFTGTESTRLELMAQLESILQGVVEIESYAINNGLSKRVSPDLVVLSTDLICSEAAPWFDASCPCITARRTLNMTRLDELFAIPVGQKLLLVNDAQETAEESVALIASLGLTHFEMIPYYPGCGITGGLERAITLGELDLVPDFVSRVIDIGPRIIDLTTVVEILERLDLLDEKANLVSARYFETIIRLHRQLYQSMEEKGRLNTYLMQVLDGVNDGILGFDRSGRITMFNQRCEEIFGLNHRKAVGRSIQHFFKSEEVDFLLNSEDGADLAFVFNQREYILNRFTVETRGAIVSTIRDSAEKDRMQLTLRRDLLRKGHVAKYSFDDIHGTSQVLLEAISNARKLARTELSVLIQGETGTGKELFASAIHKASGRSEGPFLAVNFSALQEELVESKLFGYVEGSFTGASKGGKSGLFEQADGGTLFLDEIGDISLRIQARLLRVLQEKEVMRVGGTDIIPIDVRIIAATHRQLSELCADGAFREDLYFRLKRLYLNIPTLQERRSDIQTLFKWFLQRNNREALSLSSEVQAFFQAYTWPGNVRELESVAEYLAAVCESPVIGLENLPPDLLMPRSVTTLKPEQPPLERDDLSLILQWIKEMRSAGQRVGRRSLAQIAEKQGIPLSENQIRSRLEKLEALGKIRIYNGRRGVELSSE
ncbi:sigma-54-dependent Fis family transcriptional regulator [Fusibacter sp. 3D3]|uniref:sigma-54 interaction domain-containing protein n=1 Tax=Fusibacter sp. 3D3 TaxID=1048380 RepID=UPI000853C486|nr:sigma 54-interacting transcriptional regulator [Fusibacter sp. 3D3]GAU79666.1 response regulator of zinc sigma-54-dependent two-component system [Fusibacter sp. 3D3]